MRIREYVYSYEYLLVNGDTQCRPKFSRRAIWPKMANTKIGAGGVSFFYETFQRTYFQ